MDKEQKETKKEASEEAVKPGEKIIKESKAWDRFMNYKEINILRCCRESPGNVTMGLTINGWHCPE